MMNIIFQDRYVDYSEISDVNLDEIKNVLLENGISIKLGDKFCNDWAGYSYYYCKNLGELDDETICSFVYLITWFMTRNPIDLNELLGQISYYKNDKIIIDCLKIYNNLLYESLSEVELCKRLFEEIYMFYTNISDDYLKKTERVNFVLSYHELKLLDKVDGENRTEKMRKLLNNYFNVE